MKRLFYIVFIITFTFAFSGCAKDAPEEVAANTLPPEKPAAAESSNAPAPKMASARASVRTPAPASVPTPAPAPPKPSIPATVQIPEGTELTVLLIDPISTGKNSAGDPSRPRSRASSQAMYVPSGAVYFIAGMCSVARG